MAHSWKREIMRFRSDAPWVVKFTCFYDAAQAMLLLLILFITLPAYFSVGMTMYKALMLFGVQLLMLGLIALMIWLVWAYTYRVRKAWYAYIILTVANVIWIAVSHFWFHKSLLRADAFKTCVDVINLTFWLMSDTKAWFGVGKHAAEI